VKAHVEEDRTSSRLTYAQKKVQVLMQFTKSGQELKKKFSLKTTYEAAMVMPFAIQGMAFVSGQGMVA